MKTIHRAHLTEAFTILPNAMLRDSRLTFRARGLLCMMMSLHEDWQTHQTWIEDQGAEGRLAVRAAVKELEQAGYLRRERLRDHGRLHACIWHWYCIPQEPLPQGRFQPDGNPPDGNRPPTKDVGIKDGLTKSGESKETAPRSEDAAPSFSAKWKPSPLSKEEQLQRTPPPQDYPSQVEFDTYLEAEGLDAVYLSREDLYSDLCLQKWRQWKAKGNKWVPIRSWKLYVAALNDKITTCMQQ